MAGYDSAGVDQAAPLNSRFLASLLLLCFSLLSTFFAFIGQPGPSCEMAFSRLRLCIDGLLTNWLKSDDVDLVSQPGFFRKSKQ